MFSHKSVSAPARRRPAPVPSPPDTVSAEHSAAAHLRNFIQHPRRCPIRIKRLGPQRRWRHRAARPDCDTGLVAHSSKHIRPGTLLEIGIPTRQGEQFFTCQVVLLQEVKVGFNLGLRFLLKADEQRIRMVEQICRIELYLRDKKHHDGPFVSNESLAQEWIRKFASRFPSPLRN